jgi:hypothetical protein
VVQLFSFHFPRIFSPLTPDVQEISLLSLKYVFRNDNFNSVCSNIDFTDMSANYCSVICSFKMFPAAACV